MGREADLTDVPQRNGMSDLLSGQMAMRSPGWPQEVAPMTSSANGGLASSESKRAVAEHRLSTPQGWVM